MSRLGGKVAIITGAGTGTGIGRASAELFVREGARVLLSGRREDLLRELANTLCERHASYVTADVSQPEDNQRLVDTAIRVFGGFDIFLANAGFEGASREIPDYPLDVFDQVMAVNVRGVFLGLKSAIPVLRKRGVAAS